MTVHVPRFGMLALMVVLATGSARAQTPKSDRTAEKKTADTGKKDAREEVPLEDAQKFLDFFNKLIDVIIQNKDACPKMAVGINHLVEANHDLVVRMNDAKAAGKRMPKAVEEKMQTRIKEMVPAMQKCGTDKEVQGAIKRMDTKSDKKK